MQDPRKEIATVVRTLSTTRSADELQEAVSKYFTPDAKFSHPLCMAKSRNEVLGLFQWCRLASPDTHVNVESVIYDHDHSVIFVEVREKLNVWFNPFRSTPGRTIVRLRLQKANGYHHIREWDDLTLFKDQVGFFAPPLLPLVTVYLWFGCLLSNLGACALLSIGRNSGLQGGRANSVGLLEAAGLSRRSKKVHGNAKN